MARSTALCFSDTLSFQAATSTADLQPLPTARGTGHRHDIIIAKFEEYLEANPNTPMYLAEICAAVGAAERTLRFACKKHLGMGPIRFLALRRMHLVRRALSDADSSTTVTRIATDHGFWELGRFSGAYRALFGETPSETLRRPAKQAAIKLNRRSFLEGRQPSGGAARDRDHCERSALDVVAGQR
jgi:transcriptional regulator GlxA family with amidase domain